MADSNCPPLAAYSDEFNIKLVDELNAAPATAVWPDAISDYFLLRRQIEACR